MKKYIPNIKKILAYSLFSLVIFSSCKKNNSNPNQVGGFNSSNDIEPKALRAHWTFDDTPDEIINGIKPSNFNGTSYVTGIKGKAISLADGYILYPNFSAVNGPDLGSVTVSCWIKIANNGSKNSNAFSLTIGTAHQTDFGASFINMGIETSSAASDSTLILQPSFTTYPNTQSSRVSGDNSGTFNGANKWVHYVTRYDGVTSNFDVFADGVMISNMNMRHKTFSGTDKGLGDLLTCGCPSQVLIGGFANAATGFLNSPVHSQDGLFNGQIDELRFYTTALTDAEINSLYLLEKAGN